MAKALLFLVCGCAGVVSSLGVANASRIGPRNGHTVVATRSAAPTTTQTDWQRRDTATYVVSTLNLLRTSNGHPLSKVAAQQLDVTRYAVWADTNVRDLYFVQMKRDDGSVAAVVAYRLGWAKPQSVSHNLTALGIQNAPGTVVTAYRADHLEFVGSFSSTLPI